MRKQRKTLLCILSLCICLLAGMLVSFDAHAEEYDGKPVTGMDEEGNIYEIEPEVGLVEEDISTFADSNEKIVISIPRAMQLQITMKLEPETAAIRTAPMEQMQHIWVNQAGR